MTILSAQTIRRLSVVRHPLDKLLIAPYRERYTTLLGDRTLTGGQSPAGYDVALAQDIHISGRGFVLASTVESFDMPDDLFAVVHDKSSWARRGITVQNTTIEPGWRGFLTLEITSHTEGISIPKGSPIAQIVFHRLDEPTEEPYEGRYQDQQAGPQEAR